MQNLVDNSLNNMLVTPRQDMRQTYSEPHRVYHTLSHIYDILQGIELAQRFYSLSEFDVQILHTVTWYHDVVYDPQAPPGENENKSANLFMNLYSEEYSTSTDINYFSPVIADMITEIIQGTINHTIVSDDTFWDGSATFLGVLFFDLDLRGMATDYDENAKLVRQEFSHLSDVEWNHGRRKFLESMLDRPIFHTSLFGALESVAKRNIAHEYEQLKEACGD